MLQNTTVLVVDDNLDDGIKICDQLRAMFIGYRLFHCTVEAVEELAESTMKVFGVRAVFQDLSLTDGGAIPRKQDYSTAATVLENILTENNGPWLLITWSTFTGASGDSEKYAHEMFEHLTESLPPGKRPFDYLVINKTDFENSGEDVGEQLSESIKEKLSGHETLATLYEWENKIKLAAAHSVAELSELVDEVDRQNKNEALGNIIYDLARAEAGKHTEDEPLKRGLHTALGRIIKDKAEILSGFNSTTPLSRTSNNFDIANWQEKLNRVSHMELRGESMLYRPGSIYKIGLTEFSPILPGSALCDSENKLRKFKRGQFLEFNSSTVNAVKNELTDKCTLFAINVTADCDYANKKVYWDRFMFGLAVPQDLIEQEILWRIVRKRSEGGPTEERVKGELKNNNLKLIANMYIDAETLGNCGLLFNSELVFPILNSEVRTILQNPEIGTIRESLLTELRSWMAKHITRPGIVELR